MAPRVAENPDRAAARLAAARAGFTRDTPCQWCGGLPTAVIDVVPAEVDNGKLKKRAHPADVCFECARRLQIAPIGLNSTAFQVAARKERATWRRKDRREAMQANQQSLQLGLDGPDDAITGG